MLLVFCCSLYNAHVFVSHYVLLMFAIMLLTVHYVLLMFAVMLLTAHYVPYMYKFSRDVNFAVFAVNLSSTKFKSSKFYKTVVIHLKYKV